MKIALFPPSLEVGGIERVTVNLANGFAAAGVHTDLVTIKAGGKMEGQINDTVNHINLGASRALTSLPRLIHYLRQHQPDVLIAPSPPVALVALWAKMLSRASTRIAVEIMNTPSAYQANPLYWRENFYPVLTRLFYPRADYVIAIAEAIRQDAIEYIKLPPEKIEVIYTPVITPDFEQRVNEVVDHPWIIQSEIPVILGVGRFVPQKDLHTLIRAFAEVRKDRPAYLIIIGDGPQRASLESLVKSLGLDNDVDMPGTLNNLPYMKRADVFVLSSLFEGLPTVLIEALACSQAIVSTNSAGGATEIVQDGDLAEIVPVKDHVALGAAILRALDTPHNIQPLRDRANDFSMDTIVHRYLDYLSG